MTQARQLGGHVAISKPDMMSTVEPGLAASGAFVCDRFEYRHDI